MGDKGPVISVVILNWNGKHMLAACIDALRNQIFKDFELIMVDNGSSDESVPYIKQYYPEVVIVELKKNLGFSAGNNAGIKYARGKYIALLNNDAMPAPEWLAALYKSLEENPDIGFCASKVVFADKPLIDSAGDVYTTGGFAHKRGHLESVKNLYNITQKVFGACAAASIYRKSMLDDIGLLDEAYFHSYEDVDLSFRAQLMGYSCLYVPNAIVYHKVSASSKEGSDFYVFYGQRNLEYAYFINMPFGLFAKYFIFHFIYMILALFYFISKKKGRAFIRAKFAILADLPSICQRRIVIQRKKRIPNAKLESILEKNWILMKKKKLGI